MYTDREFTFAVGSLAWATSLWELPMEVTDGEIGALEGEARIAHCIEVRRHTDRKMKNTVGSKT